MLLVSGGYGRVGVAGWFWVGPNCIAVRGRRGGKVANGERDFILGELKRSGVVGEVRWHQEGERLNLRRVNHYGADHEVAVATLA
jgi:hypothetical protein